jgi:S1-C subfamily serine protease
VECGATQSGGSFPYTNQNDGAQTVTPEEKVIENVFAKTANGVVGIGLKGNDFNDDSIIGTGFVVTANGLILTNRHVVEEQAEYFVNLSGSDEVIPVTKIFRDPVNDLALIQIDRTGLTALALGDSSQLKIGQTVIAIGNPLGSFSGTVTSGIISGLNREVTVGEGFFGSAGETYDDVIQTDAAINPGNSGGPLLNADGEVIGINFATISGADNLSFALPINRAKSRIDELNKFGKFRIPFIGVEYRMRLVFIDGNSTVGAQVNKVIPDSPASRAGILSGDVIVEFNGQDLTEKSLFALIQGTEIGQDVSLTIVRGGETHNLTVKIGERGD